MEKNQNKRVTECRQRLYDQVQINFTKGTRESVKEHAAKMGESMNSFILRAIRETMERDMQN